jgi:hypothetical protein
MIEWGKEISKKIKYIIPNTISSTGITVLSSTTYGGFFDLTISCSTGNIYINTLTTSPTSTNSFLLAEGDVLNLQVSNYLSLFGDSTTSVYKGIVWDYT